MFRASLLPGVELKLLEERHAYALYSAISSDREYLREWLPWVDATRSTDDTREFIDKSLRQFAKNAGFHAGIWVDGEYAGTIGCQAVNWANRKVELGYWLGSRYTGRGIMTAAVSAMCDQAFDEWSLNRVQLQCAAGNVRSQAIPRRLGFREEGLIEQGQLLYGKFHDLIVFGMLRSMWERNRQGPVLSS